MDLWTCGPHAHWTCPTDCPCQAKVGIILPKTGAAPDEQRSSMKAAFVWKEVMEEAQANLRDVGLLWSRALQSESTL